MIVTSLTVAASILAQIPPLTAFEPFTRDAIYAVHDAEVDAIVRNPQDFRMVFTNGLDESVRKVDLCTGRTLWTFRRPGIDTSLTFLIVSPRGRYLATGDPLDRGFVIDTETGIAKTFSLPRDGWRLPPTGAAFSSDERSVFFAHDDKILQYEIDSGTLLASYKNGLVGGLDTVGIGLRADGRIWALSQQRGYMCWQPELPQAPLFRREIPTQAEPTSVTRLFGDQFLSMQFRDTLNGLQHSGLVDADTGLVVQDFGTRNFWSWSLDLSADLRLTVIPSFRETLRFYETRTGREVGVIATVSSAGDSVGATAVTLDPAGDLALVGLRNGEIAIYSVHDALHTRLCPRLPQH